MSKIRVLVADDSVVMRRLVSEALATDPSIEVVATASSGKIALAKLAHVNPDVVTLDLEMPEMDGFETLKAIRETHPTLPVIVFSSLSQPGAESTIEALALGANDYVPKPTSIGDRALTAERVREQLIQKVKLFGAMGRAAPTRPRPLPVRRPSAPPGPPPREPAREPIEMIALGTSTGGPNALDVVLTALPADLRVPMIVVQHMPPQFTRYLAERLELRSRLRVCEAEDGMELTAGGVYIAPGDFHLEVQREGRTLRARTTQGPPENSCRPAVDVSFRSVVSVFGARTLGVVLTGMGRDGLRGAEAIRSAGGRVIVQDEATSVVWGMPRFIAEAGLAHEILPIEQIAGGIVRGLSAPSWRPSRSEGERR